MKQILLLFLKSFTVMFAAIQQTLQSKHNGSRVDHAKITCCQKNSKTSDCAAEHAWASERYFAGEATAPFPGRRQSGELPFYQLETKETTSFAENLIDGHSR